MADDPDHRMQQPHPRARPRRLLEAFSSPDSYGLVLLLIVASYTLSAATTTAWALSLVLFVQIATIWTTLQASQARRRLREVTTAVLVISAAIAILNLFLPRQPTGNGLMAVVAACSMWPRRSSSSAAWCCDKPWTPRPCWGRSPPT